MGVTREGLLRIALRDYGGAVLARSNPLLVRRGKMSGYWADLHGQSGESGGINTARQHFAFARDCAFLDAWSHLGRWPHEIQTRRPQILEGADTGRNSHGS